MDVGMSLCGAILHVGAVTDAGRRARDAERPRNWRCRATTSDDTGIWGDCERRLMAQ